MKKLIKRVTVVFVGIIIFLAITIGILSIPTGIYPYSGKPSNIVGFEIDQFHRVLTRWVIVVITGHDGERGKSD